MAITVEPLTTALAKQKPLPWMKLDINTVRYNQVAAFTLTLPAVDRAWDLVDFDADGVLKPKAGFLIDWNGVFELPCKAEQANLSRTIDDAGNITETIVFSGGDFLSLLADRIVFRNPALPWTGQTVGTSTVTGKAETVIKQIVTGNLVTAGDTTRRVPGFAVAPDLARGGDVTYTIVIKDPAATGVDKTATIGDTVMDMVRAVARQSDIGVRIDLINGQLVFDCFIPRDLTEKVVFSERLGNLRAWNITDATPTGNAILAQSGTPTGAFTTGTGPGATDPWRRVESYSDQTSTIDAAQLNQARLDELAKGAAATKINLTAVDIPRCRFGRDAPGIQGYSLGDRVAADIRDGVVYTDIVSAVHLTADGTSATYTETVTPTIGRADDTAADDATDTAQLAAQVRRLEQALRNLR
ncbi:Gp37-like protein [Spirillospora sp. CA-294931]|uniref:Gp37-like protein n=1 Tax=Spirillospora sp. CA-294931 TaxID=3240042 RepID=UPI003D8F4CC3